MHGTAWHGVQCTGASALKGCNLPKFHLRSAASLQVLPSHGTPAAGMHWAPGPLPPPTLPDSQPPCLDLPASTHTS